MYKFVIFPIWNGWSKIENKPYGIYEDYFIDEANTLNFVAVIKDYAVDAIFITKSSEPSEL